MYFSPLQGQASSASEPLSSSTSALRQPPKALLASFSCLLSFPSSYKGTATAAKSLSRVRLCATPQTAARQAPRSLGFSRREHGSGLPFPSPVHESEKGKGSRSVVSDSSRPRGPQPTRLLHPWDCPGESPGVGCHCLLPVRAVSPACIHFIKLYASVYKPLSVMHWRWWRV